MGSTLWARVVCCVGAGVLELARVGGRQGGEGRLSIKAEGLVEWRQQPAAVEDASLALSTFDPSYQTLIVHSAIWAGHLNPLTS